MENEPSEPSLEPLIAYPILTLTQQFLRKSTLFHVEGYQLNDPDLVFRTLETAKAAGLIISIDLANAEIVCRNKTFIRQMLNEYVDVVFCNELEAEELTGLSPAEACDELSTLCSIAVVTMGEQGSWARRGNEKIHMEALPTKAIDTTGAGDLYASGFLHGYLKGASLKECMWQGTYIAAQVVKRIGAEIPEDIWEDIQLKILEEGKAFD